MTNKHIAHVCMTNKHIAHMEFSSITVRHYLVVFKRLED